MSIYHIGYVTKGWELTFKSFKSFVMYKAYKENLLGNNIVGF